MTLLSLSSPRNPLRVWLITRQLIQQPVRPEALFALGFDKATQHGPMAASRGSQAQSLGGHLLQSLGYTFPLGESRCHQCNKSYPTSPIKACSRHLTGCFFQHIQSCLMKIPTFGCHVY